MARGSELLLEVGFFRARWRLISSLRRRISSNVRRCGFFSSGAGGGVFLRDGWRGSAAEL